MASFLLSFLSLNKVCKIYGPLFIELVFEISTKSILFSIILFKIVSFISVPIFNISSPILISLCRNLPSNDWFDTYISFKPSFANFFAVKKLIFSPILTTTLLFLASITSSEKFFAL